MQKATEQKKTKKERTAMRRIKILTVMLAVMLIGVCIFGGCASGTLYSLEELYAAGEIDKEDLLNIAYHNGDAARNEEAMQGFEPTPIGELDEKISKKMRARMAKDCRDDGTHPEATAENFSVFKYLGCYNGYYAARFSDNLSLEPDVYLGPDAYVYEVGGIKFDCPHTTRIYLWK